MYLCECITNSAWNKARTFILFFIVLFFVYFSYLFLSMRRRIFNIYYRNKFKGSIVSLPFGNNLVMISLLLCSSGQYNLNSNEVKRTMNMGMISNDES